MKMWIDAEEKQKLANLLQAKYQLVYAVTHEEDRLQDTLCEISEELGVPLYAWSFTNGMQRIEENKLVGQVEAKRDPVGLIDVIRRKKDGPGGDAIFWLKDFHTFIQGGQGFETIRALRDYFFSEDSWAKSIVISAPYLKLPNELEKHAEVVEFPLPGEEHIGAWLDHVHEQLQEQKGEGRTELKDRERLIGALKGLTRTEISAVCLKSIAVHDALDYDTFIEEKRQILKKNGSLDYYNATETLNDVGGLGNLKKWLEIQRAALDPRAQEFGVDAPRGVLLWGLPGTGKSLTAKATAHMLGIPLIMFDITRVMGSLYGQSETNMREAMRTIEAVAPVVVFIDEIEKVLSGGGSSNNTDGGTTDHLLGMMLTWMQERKKPIFFVGAANSLNSLPDHLIRAGRFDTTFFVDLPTQKAREEIFAIHLRKRGRDPERFDLHTIARATEGFSGAEIEQVVSEAIKNVWALHRGVKDITTEILIEQASKVVPLSRSKKTEIEAIRKLAQESQIQPASEPEEIVVTASSDKVQNVRKKTKRAPDLLSILSADGH